MPNQFDPTQETERQIIREILIKPDVLDTVLGILTPHDFLHPGNKEILQEMLLLQEEGLHYNEILIGDRIKEKNYNLFDRMGGYAYLGSFIEVLDPLGNIEAWMTRLKQYHIKIKGIQILNNLQKTLNATEVSNVPDLIESASSYLKGISDQQPKKANNIDFQEVLRKTFSEMEALSLNDSEITGVESGFTALDKITSGFQKGEYTIIAARAGMGKSTLAQNIATREAAKEGSKVLFFTIEMKRTTLVKRILSAEGTIKSDLFRHCQFSETEWKSNTSTVARIQNYNLIINDTSQIPINKLVSATKEVHQKSPISLLLIDYIQKIRSTGKYNTRDQELTEISGKLQGLAKDLNIPIIALSQLNREVDKRTDKKPVMSDLRESGSLEQDADLILLLYRDDYYYDNSKRKGIADIIIGKHRHGYQTEFPLIFQGWLNRFMNPEDARLKR